jgi:hypothetical protein
MQFDITGFLIFLAFILPGFVAQKARFSLAPRSLKPLSPVGEVGEFVLTGVWVHVLLALAIGTYFSLFARQYCVGLANAFHYGTLSELLWNYRIFAFFYFVSSLVFGYFFGFLQGVLVIKQPIRTWLVREQFPRSVLTKIGVPGFLQEDPVWYFVLKRESAATMVFLEVEMKKAAGFYTGRLRSYGILDDSVKSKDFYLVDVHFKENRLGSFVPLQCDGVLLNFEDVASIQVVKMEDEGVPPGASESGSEAAP